MGTMLKYGSEGAKEFYKMYVIDPNTPKPMITGISIYTIWIFTR